MDNEELRELVLAAAGEREGRKVLSCAEAFRLAEEHGVELMDIARICNTNSIKFIQCQIGCFR
jgi:hypothetical protein